MAPFAILAALALGDAGDLPAATQGRSEPLVEKTFTVGQVLVVGHEDMVTSFILDHLGFGTGDVVTYRTLRQAERRLAGLGVFVVDTARGVRPEITPQGRGRTTDVEVKVVEIGKTPFKP